MNNKLTYNVSFLMLISATIGLAFLHNSAAIGTGVLSLFFYMGHIEGWSPRD